MEVRAGFEEQLGRFFDLLDQSVTTGDPAWMDSILMDWAKSSTETDLEEGLYHVSFLLNRMIVLTIQVARDELAKQQALDLLAAVIVYTYGRRGCVTRWKPAWRTSRTRWTKCRSKWNAWIKANRHSYQWQHTS
jgi:hypothetical protein